MSELTIAFWGMTHLGLNTAVGAASKGFQVIGYDEDAELIDNLAAGRPHIDEPQLTDLMQAHKERLSFSHEAFSLNAADIIYIAIDVPTDLDNRSDLSPIENALKKLIPHLNDAHIVVVLSQVNPGFTRKNRLPRGQLFYQVETLVFGSAIERTLFPERYIVGAADSGVSLPENYQRYLNAYECPVFVMKYESAELAKISINMFLVSSVMTTNMLSELANSLGANWNEIVPTLRLDKRIGPHAYLKPGLGISGGNLERDIVTVLESGRSKSTHTELANLWLEESRYYKNWVWRTLCTCIGENSPPRIAVLGIAYKANTHSIKNAPSLLLMESLERHGIEFRCHDPFASAPEKYSSRQVGSIDEALQGAEIAVIMNDSGCYRELEPERLKAGFSGRLILDPNQVLEKSAWRQSGFTVHSLENYAVQTLHDKELDYA